LPKESVLVIGLGEVGRPLYELLNESGNFVVYAYDQDEAKMSKVGQNKKDIPKTVNVMHICIPCVDRAKFINIVTAYANQFKPELMIIDSTVVPGTTKELSKRCKCLIAHSPIRGVHQSLEHMKWELKRWTKYVGGASAEAGEAARRHLEKMGLKTKTMKSCAETELAKLFETTYRVWMITCFQEMHRISRHFETDFDDTLDFLEDTHRVRLDRPVMFPGVIGGHCLIPNIQLLSASYDSSLLTLALRSNERRVEEIKDERVRKELEKVKKRAEAFEKELMEAAKCLSRQP
jgi:UDP-N-acetyl-D-mannosaminuronate dehydrogenase